MCPLHESGNLPDIQIFVSHTFLGPTASWSTETIVSSASVQIINFTLDSDKSNHESLDFFTHFVHRLGLTMKKQTLSSNTLINKYTPLIDSSPPKKSEEAPINDIAGSARETNVPGIIFPTEERVIIDTIYNVVGLEAHSKR